MRWRAVVVVLLVGACSFEPGHVPSGDDGGRRPDANAPDGGVDAPPLVTKKLVIDNSQSTIDLVDLPVLVPLDATTIDYSFVEDPTTDLRFEYATAGTTANVGDNVPFEVEKWNPGGESIVWIRVPELRAGSTDTAVLMHYGPSAGGQADPAATWNGWELVHHMADGAKSSTGRYDGTPVNVTFERGQVGDAVWLAGGTNRGVTFASSGELFDGWSDFTLSFWIYADYESAAELGGTEPHVMDKGTSVTLGRVYATSGGVRFQLDLHFQLNVVYAQIAPLPLRTWTMVTIASDGDQVYLARNGNEYGTAELTGTNQRLLASTLPFFIGSMNTVFAGAIDELRIERQFRPNDYVRAHYLSMTRQLVTFTDP